MPNGMAYDIQTAKTVTNKEMFWPRLGWDWYLISIMSGFRVA